MEYSEALKALKKDSRKFFERGWSIWAVEARIKAQGRRVERMRKLSEGRTLTDRETVAMNEIADDITKDLAELSQVQREIGWAVKTFLQDPELQTLFICRYINCETWVSIGEKMHYSTRWAYRMHKRGLEIISKAVAAAAPETC